MFNHKRFTYSVEEVEFVDDLVYFSSEFTPLREKEIWKNSKILNVSGEWFIGNTVLNQEFAAGEISLWVNLSNFDNFR